MDHPWRSNKRYLNGKIEFRPPLQLLKGIDVFDVLQIVDNAFGKKQKKIQIKAHGRKDQYFSNYLIGNTTYSGTTLMSTHIEKNIVDNIIDTFWNIPRKTKDNASARFDLKEIGN